MIIHTGRPLPDLPASPQTGQLTPKAINPPTYHNADSDAPKSNTLTSKLERLRKLQENYSLTPTQRQELFHSENYSTNRTFLTNCLNQVLHKRRT